MNTQFNFLEQLESFLAQPELQGQKIVLNSDVNIMAAISEPSLAN